jgi:uncharacterized protein
VERKFGAAGTTVSVAFLTAVAALSLVQVWPPHPLKRLERPVASTLRVVGRELDRAAITPQLTGWQRRLPTAAAPAAGPDDPLALASARYGELLDMLERGQLDEPVPLAGPLRARLALVLAEQDRWPEAQAVLARAEAPALAAAMAAGYRHGPAVPPDTLARALAAFTDPALPPAVDEWPADRLRARVLARAGDHAGAAQATAAIEARGWRVWRRAALAVVPLLLSTLALLAACAWLLVRRRLEPVAAGLTTAPFTLGHGLALMTRAAALGYPLAFLLSLLAKTLLGVADTGFGTLLFSLPLMLYLRRELAAHGLAVAPALGLRGVGGGRALLLATLLLLGLEQLLALGADLAFAVAGHQAHYAEVLFDDALLFGSAPRAALFAIEAVVWAPLFEEIGFRGVLYPSLRTRLRPLPAAMASALVFASVHLYSLGGATQIFLGAVASALVYERTRSLWPCIAAHAFNNAAALVASTLVYR